MEVEAAQAAHGAITLAIGGGVGTLSRVLTQAGLHGRMASIVAALISFLFVGVRALDAGDFQQGNYLNYLLSYVETLAIAAGTFHGLNEAQKKLNTATGE